MTNSFAESSVSASMSFNSCGSSANAVGFLNFKSAKYLSSVLGLFLTTL